ncbi:hypothetical protein D477_014211 [Arthrobacter crystallopoietes BAB-32]|uniref:Uncharacterized protein n=1 Tax=Arthrobacter crystallopoietes BAB-32 TaxID=1246476 RepID=N1V0F2_9MICC|nr:hypothetical protein [Arthrobacter crystallopoietes]EMY33562.1 hypothetical protein D477_014211 [Arthrobacter crystallopoietes BAB-32]
MSGDAAIEAARQAVREHDRLYAETCFCGDGECTGSCTVNLDEIARVAVEAAAPLLTAQALHRAAGQVKDRRVFGPDGAFIPVEDWLSGLAGPPAN